MIRKRTWNKFNHTFSISETLVEYNQMCAQIKIDALNSDIVKNRFGENVTHNHLSMRCFYKKQRLNATMNFYKLKEISVPLTAAAILKIQALIANKLRNRNILYWNNLKRNHAKQAKFDYWKSICSDLARRWMCTNIRSFSPRCQNGALFWNIFVLFSFSMFTCFRIPILTVTKSKIPSFQMRPEYGQHCSYETTTNPNLAFWTKIKHEIKGHPCG